MNMPHFSGDLWVPVVLIILVALVFSGKLGNRDRSNTEDTSRLQKSQKDPENAEDVATATPAAEHKTGGGHGSVLTLTAVLLVLGIGGELLYALNGPVPNFVRAINQPYDFKAHNTVLPQSAFAHKKAAQVVIPKPGVMQIPAAGAGYSPILPIPAGTDLCMNLSPGDRFGVEHRKRPFTDNDHWVDVGAGLFTGANADRFYGTTAEPMLLGYGFVANGEACPAGDYPTS